MTSPSVTRQVLPPDDHPASDANRAFCLQHRLICCDLQVLEQLDHFLELLALCAYPYQPAKPFVQRSRSDHGVSARRPLHSHRRSSLINLALPLLSPRRGHLLHFLPRGRQPNIRLRGWELRLLNERIAGADAGSRLRKWRHGLLLLWLVSFRANLGPHRHLLLLLLERRLSCHSRLLHGHKRRRMVQVLGLRLLHAILLLLLLEHQLLDFGEHTHLVRLLEHQRRRHR